MDPEQFQKNTVSDGYSSLPQDADQFVPVPQEEDVLDYGKICAELASVTATLSVPLLPVPIRLVNGKHFGIGGGYGVAHIMYHHGNAIARFDYHSIQDFVDDIANSFDAVYFGRERRHLIVKRKGGDFALDRLLVLELAKTKDHYSVVSGWTVATRRPIAGELIAERTNKDGVMVWECRAPHSNRPGLPNPTPKQTSQLPKSGSQTD